MSEQNDFENFKSFLVSKYSDFDSCKELLSPNIISSFVLRLPKSVFGECQKIVSALHEVRQSQTYQQQIEAADGEMLSFDPGNFSALMAIDFHLSEDGQPKIIEINTNASAALVMDALREYRQLPNVVDQSFVELIKKTFMQEVQLSPINDVNRAAILDEDPESQKMFLEFVLYRQMFSDWGWETEICRPEDLRFDEGRLFTNSGPLDLIYNRFCDFLLQEERSQPLRQSYLQGKICLSPNPHEYQLMADKNRLADLSQTSWREPLKLSAKAESVLEKCLPKTTPITHWQTPEDFWKDRKRYFIKPGRSHGGKGAFRAGTMSRRILGEMFHQGTLAQEYIPATVFNADFGAPEGTEKFKFDFRVYSYQDQMQLAAARIYQGQTTNYKTPGGGFAPVQFVD